jgi:alpha-1,2-mannosyltransferase
VTRPQLEFQLAVLPLYIAGLFLVGQLAWNLSTPTNVDRGGLIKGHDFVQFYTLGRLALERDMAPLYDFRALNEAMWRYVPESKPDAFPAVYGPQVALAFAPLARLPYAAAVYCWMAISSVLYVCCCAATIHLFPVLRQRRVTVWALLILFPGFIILLVAGQTTAVALTAITLAMVAFTRGREWWAGVALGVLAYKPQLAVGFAVLGLIGRNWRLLAGMATTAAVQAWVAFMWVGTAGLVAYLGALRDPVSRLQIVELIPEQLHSLAGVARLLLGRTPVATTVYVLASLLLLFYVARAWIGNVSRDRRFATAILASVLIAPHLYVYDLLLLMPVLATAWAHSQPLERRGRLRQWTVWAGWLTPLIGPLALLTRVQLSLIVFVALLAQLGKADTDLRRTDAV